MTTVAKRCTYVKTGHARQATTCVKDGQIGGGIVLAWLRRGNEIGIARGVSFDLTVVVGFSFTTALWASQSLTAFESFKKRALVFWPPDHIVECSSMTSMGGSLEEYDR